MKRIRKKYLWAVYIIVALVAIIFLFLSYQPKSNFLEAVFLNFATELLGAVFIFIIVDYFLINDEWTLAEQVKNLIDKINGQENINVSKVFSQKYIPHNIEDVEYKDAETIYIVGYSLSRLVRTKMSLFEEMLKKQVKIKFIILDGNNTNVIEQIDARTSENLDKKLWKTRLKEAQSLILALKKIAPEKNQVELGVLPYIPGFGMVIINKIGGDSVLYTILYPHKSGETEPAFKLEKIKDQQWYNFFDNQFEIFWNDCKIIHES